jgi:hypothetical protein
MNSHFASNTKPQDSTMKPNIAFSIKLIDLNLTYVGNFIAEALDTVEIQLDKGQASIFANMMSREVFDPLDCLEKVLRLGNPEFNDAMRNLYYNLAIGAEIDMFGHPATYSIDMQTRIGEWIGVL